VPRNREALLLYLAKQCLRSLLKRPYL